MEKKKLYEAPSVRRVRLDIKQAVLGHCQQSPDWIISPTCDVPGTACSTQPQS